MILIKTKMKKIPNTCKECPWGFNKFFVKYCGAMNGKECEVIKKESGQFAYTRPNWCPIVEVFMGEKMKIKCDFCKQEFCATPYLFNHTIKKEHHPVECRVECLAKCDARFLCNFCGQIFVKNFSREISKRDIERIALGERSNENAE